MKKAIILNVLLIAVIAAVISSCEKEKTPPPSYQVYKGNPFNQYYEVEFSKTDTTASAHAWFSDVRTSRQIIFPRRSMVKANGIFDTALYGSSLEFHSWNFHDSVITFTVDKENATLTNAVSWSSVNDVKLVMDSVLSVNDTMFASFTGASLDDGEYIGLSMNRENDSLSIWSGISVQFFDRKAALDFSQTRKFTPGTYTVHLSRQKQIPLQQYDGTAGGYVTVTITDKKKVVVK